MSSRLALREIGDEAAMQRRLVEKGLNIVSAGSKAAIFAAASKALVSAGAKDSETVYAIYVPGRVEVLGKHTDYAGGRSIVAAADKGFCVLVRPRPDDNVRIINVGWGQEANFRMHPDLAPAEGHWSNYAMTVARRVARNFPGGLKGADIALGSDLPAASGMSSSSAMLVACFLVLSEVNNLPQRREYRGNINSPEDLAEYLGTVENGQSFRGLVGDKGVGTFGGSEDHTAILCCKPGLMSQYSYCPVRFERNITMPVGCVFAIAASGVKAEKTGSAMEKYNRASLLAREVAQAWRNGTGRNDPHMAAAIASSPDADGRIREILLGQPQGQFSPRELLDRYEQFFIENEMIIPAAGDAMLAGDVGQIGRWVDRSQELAQTLLKNQVDQTVFLAATARKLGAVAASAFGAGFGGSVWAMVKEDSSAELVRRWSERYSQAYPDDASQAGFFVTSPGPSAFEL